MGIPPGLSFTLVVCGSRYGVKLARVSVVGKAFQGEPRPIANVHVNLVQWALRVAG